MIVLITGGCKNGKSNLAQDLAVSSAKEQGGRLYYVATMISTGKEDDDRIKKHVDNRKGLGFETIELKYNIENLVEVIRKNQAPPSFLVDSLTALLANEMFRTDDSGNFYVDHEAADRVKAGLNKLMDECEKKGASIVFVSDGIYSDAIIYGDETLEYQKGLASLDAAVARKAHKLIEMCAGANMNSQELAGIKPTLVVGGAFQGKRAFAIDSLRLKEEEIYCITDNDTELPKGYRGYEHGERLVRNLLKNSSQSETETTDIAKKAANMLVNADLVIIDDITCGIVPMDALDRKAREETGRLMQILGKDRKIYRVSCGKGTLIG